MAKTKLAASLCKIAAILFFLAGALRSEGRAVNIALGAVFLIFAANAKRKSKADIEKRNTE
jgi:hypothetical protein